MDECLNMLSIHAVIIPTTVVHFLLFVEVLFFCTLFFVYFGYAFMFSCMSSSHVIESPEMEE